MGKNMKRKPEHNTKKNRQFQKKDDAYRGKQGKDRDDDKEYYAKRGENDISWYTRYPELAVAAASVPYPNRPGMKVAIGSYNIPPTGGGATVAGNATYNVPGVMVLPWMPTVGYSDGVTSPASIVAREMYSRVRSKYSGSLEADPPDFLMYVMALDSIYAFIAHMKRMYRISNAYSPNNYVLPMGLMSGLVGSNATIEDVIVHRTKLWQYTNELVHMVSKFTCPASMDIINRHYWLSDNIYTDSNSLNSQFYMMKLSKVYQFALNPVSGSDIKASGLNMVNVPFIKNSSDDSFVDTLFKFGRTLIDTLSAWDDAYTINGYLMRAYEGSPLFAVDVLNQDEVLVPLYSEEVLTQIENSFPIPTGSVNNNVTQDVATNSVICKPNATITGELASAYVNLAPYNLLPTISIRSDAPTVADTIIATRLKNAMRVTSASGTTVKFNIECATEILMGTYIVDFDGKYANNYTVGPYDIRDYTQQYYVRPSSEDGAAFLSAFDWHPLIWTISITRDGSSSSYTYKSRVTPMGDIHNLTFVTTEVLENIHKICVYSEFNAFNM